MSNAEQAQKEFDELKSWVIEEENKITEKLKAEGKYACGLDTNNEAYSLLHAEYKKRALDIQNKYK